MDTGMALLETPRASETETQFPIWLLAGLQDSDCHLGKPTGLLGSLQDPAFSNTSGLTPDAQQQVWGLSLLTCRGGDG